MVYTDKTQEMQCSVSFTVHIAMQPLGHLVRAGRPEELHGSRGYFDTQSPLGIQASKCIAETQSALQSGKAAYSQRGFAHSAGFFRSDAPTGTLWADARCISQFHWGLFLSLSDLKQEQLE